ncbi:PREDICTED: uncharacterized protein LOC105455819 [Wasmannia auropunctata]|uniref:uncharacterized protein LOC105455819 n=1 Tax=Wasmannia auropunctata TaxID=64793 RepID=UPI0005F08A72|nr:PREDICTED: uncharacterized protein LOC105455819 [Wasmannia auropunctata]
MPTPFACDCDTSRDRQRSVSFDVASGEQQRLPDYRRSPTTSATSLNRTVRKRSCSSSLHDTDLEFLIRQTNAVNRNVTIKKKERLICIAVLSSLSGATFLLRCEIRREISKTRRPTPRDSASKGNGWKRRRDVAREGCVALSA